MREHSHQQHRDPDREQIRRRPCELFVPRVKESRLCSVCGFTLIDHDVEPVPYQHSTTGSLSHKPKNFLQKPLGLQHSRSVDGGRDFINPNIVHTEYKLYQGLLIPQAVVQRSPRTSPFYMTRTMEGGLTPSLNSAFSKYERSPSKDSITISDYSVSPVSFKNSSYLETPRHSRSASITRMENLLPPPTIIKPKPLPMPRPYLKHYNSLAPTAEDEREDFIEDFENESPQMFRRIRQKRRDRSASSHTDRSDRRSISPVNQRVQVPPPQETVVRPPNFKELLSRFQTAASDVSPSPPTFQRHHSVRLPSTNHQNRRFTLGGEALMIDTKFLNEPKKTKSNHSPIPLLQPPPVIKLRTSMNISSSGSPVTISNRTSDHELDIDHEKRRNEVNIVKVDMKESQPIPPKREKQFIQRRESDAYQAAIRAKRAGLVGSIIEKKASGLRDSDEDEPRSSPDEDTVRSKRSSVVGTPAPPIKKRQSKVIESNPNSSEGSYQATNAVAVRKPKPAHRSNSNLNIGAQRKLSSHSILSNNSDASSLRNLKDIDENSNDKHFNEHSHHQSIIGSRPATAEYISGGSDSGYPRYTNSAETSSLESPRSPSQIPRSPNPLRSKAAEDLYGQMTVQHTNTLAFMIDNYSDISRQHGEFGDYGRDLFDEISIESLIFKSTNPLMVKERIVLFDAAYLTPNYTEHKVTVMLTPTCQYAPLMGRLAERSGFGPSVLAELEEPEVTLRHLLDQAGIDMPTRSSIYKVVVMPPLSVCSFHSLAAHNMHKAMNVQRYEHHVCFIMLQLLCALKVLQSDGVEHLSNNFKEFLLIYKATDLKNTLEELHHLPKLMLLREIMEDDFDERSPIHLQNLSDSPRVGVCRYALRALCTLLNHKMHNVVPKILDRSEFSRPLRRCAELLHLDKSSSLTEAKNLLEFTFFCGRVNFEGEFEAKLWLDERRAHEVNRLVRLLADKAECLSEARERMYIQFLLSATPRTLFNTCRQYNKL